jgi:hypothetical protein
MGADPSCTDGRRVPADHPDRLTADRAYRHAASRGEPLSQRITPRQVAQVRAALARYPERDQRLRAADLDAFVTGVRPRRDLPVQVQRDLASLTREAKTSAALWPRKVGAIVQAIVSEQTR